MSHEGRAPVSSVPDEAVQELFGPRDSTCAAGTSFPSRLVNRPNRKPLDLAQRLALSALVVSGRMIKRTDGFGTEKTTLIPNDVAVFLKGRRYAVVSFDSNTIYPSEKAKNFIAEGGTK